MEYYGGVLRNPNNEMCYYNDDGSGKIDITYNMLLNRIERYLDAKKGTEDLNFQINLFTLCSLIQVRLGKKDLNEERIEKYTYNQIGNMSRYKNLWNVYGKNSPDINGKIAYELDKIQAIYQFYVYLNDNAGFTEEKIQNWKKEKNNITTLLGQKILKEVLQERFEANE